MIQSNKNQSNKIRVKFEPLNLSLVAVSRNICTTFKAPERSVIFSLESSTQKMFPKN